MATNLKGKGRFVGFLLLHGEKIAIGVVGLAALWFVYKSFKLEKLDAKFQADMLQNEISQTNTEIKNFTWENAVSNHRPNVRLPQTIADKDLTIKFDDYVPLDASSKPNMAVAGSIVAPLILREDPVLVNVVDVRATGGSGLFAFVDEEIRKQQALRLAEEAAVADKKAAEKLKKEQKAAENAAGKGRNTRGPDAAALANEPIDPAHPKRRMVVNSMGRPATGTMLQGGERIERAYWACVTAKVPIREQLKLYQDALEKARGADPVRDFPSYVGFFVERAEVLPGKELKWTAVPLYDGQRSSIAQDKPLTTVKTSHVVADPAFQKLLQAAQSFWAGGVTPDVIDDRFANYPLTLPLPPLIGREWGAEATHPDIPLAINTPPLEDESQQLAAQAAAQAATATDPGAGFGTATPTQGTGPMPGGPGPGYGAGRAGGEFFGGPGAGRGRMMEGPGAMPGMGPGGRRFFGGPGGPGGGPEGGMAYRGGGSGQVASQKTVLPKGVDYYLLRFFDFSVEPGKKYKYRVKLVVTDPNFNMPQGVLAPAVLDRQAKDAQTAKANNAPKRFYRILDNWSDPTPTVGIPMAGNVRLAEAKIPAADRYNDEPAVKMLVEAFDVDETGNPIQAAAERDFRRGYVANFVQDTEYLVDPTMIDTMADFKFLTGMTLLDVDGGAKLVRDLTVPSRILVMGSAGELYIRNEIDDKPFVESHRLTFEKPKGNQPGGPERGPGGPGMPVRGRQGRG